MRISLTAPFAALGVLTASWAAMADVKRHEFVPASLQGSWGANPDVCKAKDKSVIAITAHTYGNVGKECAVDWVAETPGARGPIFSARLNCTAAGEKGAGAWSDVILWPKDANHISVGASFDNLTTYERCASN